MKNSDMKDYKAPVAANYPYISIILLAVIASICAYFLMVGATPGNDADQFLKIVANYEYEEETPLALCGDDGVWIFLANNRTLLVEGATCN